MAFLKENIYFLKRKSFLTIYLVLTCFLWSPAMSFWFFGCRHGNGRGDVGDPCSLFCRCHSPNTCEAGVQRCVSPGKLRDPCHMTRPCGKGLSCHPGVQRCYHVPRVLYEPCVAGFDCERGLTCHPGIQVCYHSVRLYNEPCVAGFPCGPGLSCQPGLQRCLHFPRHEGERCSLGFECGDGLECTMCGKSYLTCQMNRVPNKDDEFYNRPYNKVAFLVTHNSFSNSVKYAVWVRNQRVSVTRQLQDGVRGLMLDIYPGWGNVEVQLCHGNCFWWGSSNLLDTLTQIRTFLEENPSEVITIIFEDYLRNPTILKRVFDQARISNHVLRSNLWGSRYKSWPTLTDMRRLGRLVVFNNVGLDAFPYTPHNMWYNVRENRYGQQGLGTRTCADRGESTFNADFNNNWSLVLVNWFGTVPNPFSPCMNSLDKLKEKLASCFKAFGQRANFLAVDYYQNGEKGGSFKAVEWLNLQWKEQFKKENSVKKWDFDIMKATKSFQDKYNRTNTDPNMDTNYKGSVTTNPTTGPYVTVTPPFSATDSNANNHTTLFLNVTRNHVIDGTSHVTNKTATTMSNLNIVEMINKTNKSANIPHQVTINGSDHLMDAIDYQTSHLTNITDHVIETINDKTGMDTDLEHTGDTTDYMINNHVINSTNPDTTNVKKHLINTTNDMTSARNDVIDTSHMTNLRDHLINKTNHIENTNNSHVANKSDPGLFEVFDSIDNDDNQNQSTPNLNDMPADNYFGSDANSTNMNVTYVNSHNGEMALSSALSNHESNTTEQNLFKNAVNDSRNSTNDLDAPTSLDSLQPVDFGNLENTGTDSGSSNDDSNDDSRPDQTLSNQAGTVATGNPNNDVNDNELSNETTNNNRESLFGKTSTIDYRPPSNSFMNSNDNHVDQMQKNSSPSNDSTKTNDERKEQSLTDYAGSIDEISPSNDQIMTLNGTQHQSQSRNAAKIDKGSPLDNSISTNGEKQESLLYTIKNLSNNKNTKTTSKDKQDELSLQFINQQFQDHSSNQYNLSHSTSAHATSINQTEFARTNESTAVYNGVELRRGFTRLPVSGDIHDTRSLEEYIDQI